MRELEKTYEEAIEKLLNDLNELYKKSFEANVDVQKLVSDVESCENFSYMRRNDFDGVDYCYHLSEYFDLDDFDEKKRESLIEYLESLSVNVDEGDNLAFNPTGEEIFIDWRESLVKYSPKNHFYNYRDELEAFIWANLQCENYGIYSGFYKYDSYDGTVEDSGLFQDYASFWDKLKELDSKTIKNALYMGNRFFELINADNIAVLEMFGLELDQGNKNCFDSEEFIVCYAESDVQSIAFNITLDTSYLTDVHDYDRGNLFDVGFKQHEDKKEVLVFNKVMSLGEFAKILLED